MQVPGAAAQRTYIGGMSKRFIYSPRFQSLLSGFKMHVFQVGSAVGHFSKLTG